MALAALTLVFFLSCKSDEPVTETADTTELLALIEECESLLNAATTDDYPESAITTFSSLISTAKTALENTSISQTAVDNLVVQLTEAKATFLVAAYDAIPENALIMGLSFDEGAGSQLTTTGNYAWTAVLTQGPSEIFGTATNLPSFVDGKVGKAMYFSNGSHLEISDYTASALESKTFSISAWVRPDSTRSGNYIISYNYWYSWKFQLQSQNKPFFTIATSSATIDVDNQVDFSAPNETWTHLAISIDLTNEKLVFYVNGVNTMEWTNDTKPGLTGSVNSYATALPLMIGACTTYTEAKTWDWTWSETPEGWDSFIGSIDELKVYNIALTDGQVSKLYSEENN